MFNKMGRISNYFFPFSRIFCCIIIYLCCNTRASSVDYILHTIGEEALEISDLQSSNVSVTFEGDQWIARLTCEFHYEITADVSWHVSKTGNRIDPDNSSGKFIVTNSIIGEGTIQSTFTINSFVYNDVDQYTCLMAEPNGYTNHTLWVAPKPTVDYDSPGIVIDEENVTVSVPCYSFPGAQLFFRLPCIRDQNDCFQDLEFQNVSSEVNETIVLSFTSNEEESSPYFQCCMKMPSYQQPNQCTVFPIYITGPGPMVLFYGEERVGLKICSTTINKCTFGGIFWSYPFLDNSSISWTTEDGTVNAGYEVFLHDFVIASVIDVKLDSSKNHTLTATDTNNKTNFYTFSPEAGQFMPLLTSAPAITLTDNHGSFSADFTCLFSASPDPVINWYKLPINGLSSTIMMAVTNSTPGYTISNRIFPANQQTKSALHISNYENFDKDAFVCSAWNTNGVLSSKPLAAYKRIYDFQLNINGTSVPEYNFIVANCSARGYPPPKISWKIIAEFDIDYEIDDLPDYDLGSTISYATVMDQGNNSFVDIECIAFNEFEPKLRRRALRTIDISHETAVIRYSPCTPDQFTSQGQCTMTCDFQSDDASALTAWDWIYYVENPAGELNQPFAIIDDEKQFQPLTPYRTQVSVTMSEYNAGWYRCWALYQNTSGQIVTEIVYNDFQIYPYSGSSSANLGDPCLDSNQCISLYSICLDGQCQCSGSNPIPFDEKPNTLKCLKPVAPDEPCVTDAQCEAGETNYVCRRRTTDDEEDSYVCTCNGHIRNVEEEGDQPMCLREADYGEACNYNEECEIADVNMQCSDECECIDDYNYDDYLQYCIYASSGQLSTTSIVVIVIAVFLASALIASIVGGMIKKRRQQPSRSTLPPGMVLTERNEMSALDSTSELPYSQLSNLSLQVEGISNASDNA